MFVGIDVHKDTHTAVGVSPFGEKLFEIVPPHCPNTWRAKPRKKNTLSFFKKKFAPAKSEMQGVFFLSGLLAYSPVCGAFSERTL